MIRLANSSMLLSSLLGLGRQGGVGDGAANLVRTAATRADQTLKAAQTKTAELPAKTATQRPAVTVSLSRMAQAAQAAQIAKAAQTAQAQPAAPPEPKAEAAPKAEPDRLAPPPETKGGPPRTANGTYFTDDEQRKLQAVVDFSRAQHQDWLGFFGPERTPPSEDVSAMTPAQARQRLDDLSVLKRFDEVRIQIGDPSLASPNPFSIAANNGEITQSMDTYMGWLKDRAAQSDTPATPTSGLNIQV
ncbi:hypothetical protein [Caulobacter segnis]